MIKYSLGCEKGHEFEGWFSSSAEFDRLVTAKLVDCPSCGSQKIKKLLMAPQINKNAKSEPDLITPNEQPRTGPSVTATKVPEAPKSVQQLAMPELAPQLAPQVADAQAKIIEQIRDLKKKIVENSENVGDRFGEEARKIHFGEAEKRGIYGKASMEEASELYEEGVEILPIPELPEDKN